MSTSEATSSDRPNPADNVTAWLEKREAEPASTTGQSETQASPAEPTVAVEAPAVQPTTPEGDWWETGLSDVNHGFLKGRKGPEVEKAFRHAETAKQQAERERNEARQQLDRFQREREAEVAARKVLAESQPRQPEIDPDAEIEAQLLENPRAGIKAIRERARNEAEQYVEKKLAELQQVNAANEQKNQVLKAGADAYDKAREALGVSPEVYNKRVRAVLVDLTDPSSPHYGDGNNIFRPEKYVEVWKEYYPDAPIPAAAPAAPVIAIPELPTPPGAKRPSNAVTSEATASPLDKETREAYRLLASYGGLDADRLIKRGERNRG